MINSALPWHQCAYVCLCIVYTSESWSISNFHVKRQKKNEWERDRKCGNKRDVECKRKPVFLNSLSPREQHKKAFIRFVPGVWCVGVHACIVVCILQIDSILFILNLISIKCHGIKSLQSKSIIWIGSKNFNLNSVESMKNICWNLAKKSCYVPYGTVGNHNQNL